MIQLFDWAKAHVKRNPGKLADRISRLTEWSGECLHWTGAKNNSGYGKLSIRMDGRHTKIYAHRLMWVLANRKEIPEGFTIDHTCCVRCCVNPKHLDVVTHQENNVRRTARYSKG